MCLQFTSEILKSAKKLLNIFWDFVPKAESIALVGQENISCSEFPTSESDLQKASSISWLQMGSVNPSWLRRQSVPIVSVSTESRHWRSNCKCFTQCIQRWVPVYPVNPGTSVPILRNLKITDLSRFSHHSPRCTSSYCYLQHLHPHVIINC